MALASVIAWNARLPPGCTVLIEAGRLWLRFLVPLARLTPARVKELVTFVAREGAPLATDAQIPAERTAVATVFDGFAD